MTKIDTGRKFEMVEAATLNLANSYNPVTNAYICIKFDLETKNDTAETVVQSVFTSNKIEDESFQKTH